MVRATCAPCGVDCTANFFVGDAPDDDAGVIAVAQDLIVPLVQVLRSLPSRRFSSMTIMPRRSQASSNSGVGGLCEVRMALQPISFSRSTRKYCNASGMAAPTPAWSW